jgi:hypothetical protein
MLCQVSVSLSISFSMSMSVYMSVSVSMSLSMSLSVTVTKKSVFFSTQIGIISDTTPKLDLLCGGIIQYQQKVLIGLLMLVTSFVYAVGCSKFFGWELCVCECCILNLSFLSKNFWCWCKF